MGAVAKFLKSLEIDLRLLGMIGALLMIWLVFHSVTGGLYLTPRNLFNLSVQTASVGVMATGMVFIIVTRNIDLSVGSLLGLLGMIMGVMQTRWMPELVGLGHWSIAIVAILVGVLAGAVIGGFQGWLVGYLTIPAFIVTLGGLLVWRGAAWWVTTGQTVAPLDPSFALLGGGVQGTLGARWSWILAAVAAAIAIALQYR
jgi:D-xylose transport system permease protein